MIKYEHGMREDAMTLVTICSSVAGWSNLCPQPAYLRALRRDILKELIPKYKNARANAAARSTLPTPASAVQRNDDIR